MYHKRQSQYNVDEINRFRKAYGLKPIIRKTINCLLCRKKFESQDYPRQRMCDRCRNEEDDFFAFSRSVAQDYIMLE